MASSSSKENPWQVLMAGAGLLVLGVTYAVYSLLMVAQSGDRQGIDAHLAEYGAIRGFEAESGLAVQGWLDLAAIVFGIVASVLILLGIGLLRGTARPGLRIGATITMIIAFIGSWIPLMSGRGEIDAVPEESLMVIVAVHAVVLVLCLLLWMPSMKAWINERASA
jgi:hypothetical protein